MAERTYTEHQYFLSGIKKEEKMKKKRKDVINFEIISD